MDERTQTSNVKRNRVGGGVEKTRAHKIHNVPPYLAKTGEIEGLLI